MTTEVEAPVAEKRPPSRMERFERALAWVLLAAVAVLSASVVVLGERQQTVAELRAAIASGDVTEVSLAGGRLGDSGRGTALVSIHWREHGIDHVTSVSQAYGPGAARRARRASPSPVVVGDVAEWLTTGGNEVTVVSTSPDPYLPRTAAAFGFTTPGWIPLGYLGVVLGSLLLAGARTPWRATPWGWGWLILLVPGGVVPFLVFGGPTGLFRPRTPGRLLTGGWSFLLALALGGYLR